MAKLTRTEKSPFRLPRLMGLSVYDIMSFFFFLVYIYSPRGLGPIVDFIYFYATSEGPVPFPVLWKLSHASCMVRPLMPAPHRTQLFMDMPSTSQR